MLPAVTLQATEFEPAFPHEVPLEPAITLRPGGPVHLAVRWKS